MQSFLGIAEQHVGPNNGVSIILEAVNNSFLSAVLCDCTVKPVLAVPLLIPVMLQRDHTSLMSGNYHALYKENLTLPLD